MQISSQKTQVNHKFEQIRERDITAVNSDGQIGHIASKNQQTLTTTVEDEAYRLTLSPEQEVQRKTIESLSGRAIIIYIEQQQLAKLSLDEAQQSNSQSFEIQGHLVNENSVLSVTQRLYEYERLDYNTTLWLDESDGSFASHNFSLNYTRELDITTQLSMTAVEFSDPLVLNIGAQRELFVKDKQKFDLDADGHKELIPELAEGAWYLAYDRNQNGRIDNGLELFGAQTGQGFTELAELDDNHNDLIESDDSLFDQLSLWDGQQTLQSLAEGGIRAIALNAANTPFTFTDHLGNATAQIRQTSVFITDNNRLGAVHQVDIAV
ncbi:hypothetical protein [uncultured Paraglaciecola sp.]|uniref:hypothetical protein n=1 Tax=uncultured Paraglaciecola sp. TaxID=1765024 RepID=UPI0030D7550F|tara:strand:- start:33323 stop:34291 length:969 start_codon:yes stop_codon:yes gene_type:complete